MTLYLVAEHDQQQIDPSFAALLTAARALSSSIIVIIFGHGAETVAAEAACFSGVSLVKYIDDPAFEHPLPEQLCPIVVEMVQGADYLLMASSTFSKAILPAVAALLAVGQVSDVIKIVNADTIERPIYAGNAIETLQCLDSLKIMSIRSAAFAADKARQNPVEIETLRPNIGPKQLEILRREESPSSRPELRSAKIVVSGGRGLQSQTAFQLIESLADALGAALGASRAAVDAGFISNDHQVGQTGKIVAPDLYIAVGISGAIQHIAGIKDAKIIVAINKDPAAPIFQVANYGLVGDLFEIVPALMEELKHRGLNKCG